MSFVNDDASFVHAFILIGISITSGIYSVISLSPPLLYHFGISDQLPYILGRSLCHQLPSRCLWFYQAQTALCAKCTGFYLATTIMAALAVKSPHLLHRRWMLFMGLLAFACTLTHSFTHEFAGLLPLGQIGGFVLGVLSAMGFVCLVNRVYYMGEGLMLRCLRRSLKAGLVLCIVMHIIGFSGVLFAQEIPLDKIVLLPAGTPVILEVMSSITAKETREGDTVMLRVKAPVRVKDYVVINCGVMARGLVTLSRSASCWGGAGEIQIDARSVSAVDSSEVLLGGTAGRRGETLHGASASVAVGGAILCLPLGLAGAAVKGEEGEIRTGYEIVARTLSDTSIRVLSEEERIQIQQQQIKESDAMMQQVQEENRKREEAIKEKKRKENRALNN